MKLKERKIRRELAIAILSCAILLLNSSAVIGSGEKEKQIPCIYKNREYKMKPFIYKSDDGKENMISYPDLPDHVSPEMSLEESETLTVRFDDEQPSDVTAYLVDYEGDITETQKLEPMGLKTFEVRARFSDGRDISYTVLTDILESN